MKVNSWADSEILECAKTSPFAERFCTGENARELWEMLRKQKRFTNKTYLSHSPEYAYYINCYSILQNTKRMPCITPGEHRNRAKKIASLAKELAQELSVNVDTIGSTGKATVLPASEESFLEMITPPAGELFRGVNRGLIINTVSRCDYLGRLGIGSPFETVCRAKDILRRHGKRVNDQYDKQLVAWREKWNITDKQWKDEKFEPSDAADADYPIELPLPMSTTVTAARMLVEVSELTMVDLLNALAQKMDDYQQGDFYLKRPSTAGVAKQVFVRQLYEYHMQLFGTPLWDALALATVISLNLSDGLSVDDIRPLVVGGRK
ncbi:hypothetical protein [Chromobacterium violaceum]|uniref:hypothetical protein n=1 Tax=Chromobacterium violaceum TaxID=536 RepID=UPI003DA844AD